MIGARLIERALQIRRRFDVDNNGLSTGMWPRLFASYGANMLGKIWTLIAQLVSVPILTHTWGAQGYGVWLMLTALPTYIGLSDFGFGGAAAVDMSARNAVGDREGALRSFQSVWVLLLSLLGAVTLLALGLWVSRPFIVANIHSQVASKEIWDASFYLVLYAVCAVQMSLISAGYRCVGRYAQGVVLLDLTVPIETVCLLVIATTGGSLASVALSMFLTRFVALCLYYYYLRLKAPWIRLGFSAASMTEIRRLWRPAVGSLSLTFSSALSLQGVILAIGFFISPAAAGTFGAARTLTRLPLQFVGIAARAAVPEMTSAHAQGNTALFSRLMFVNVTIAVAIALPSFIAIILCGPSLLTLLSHGALRSPRILFFGLSLSMLATAVWSSAGQGLFAINRQHLFSHYYIPLSIIAIITPAVFVAASQLWLTGMAVALGDLVMLVLCIRAAKRASSTMA